MSELRQGSDPDNVLNDVRRALGRKLPLRPPPLERFIEPFVEAASGALVERFVLELTALAGHAHRAAFASGFSAPPLTPTEVCGSTANIIEDICRSAAITEVALSGSAFLADTGLESELIRRNISVFVPDVGCGHEQLVSRLAVSGAGITAADYAIAETGTIVLSSDESNALLVSLLPPIHIALVGVRQISASLDQVISKLAVERVGRAEPSRSVSFITGPSRTSDVELSLSIGVHGPKELHVNIVDG